MWVLTTSRRTATVAVRPSFLFSAIVWWHLVCSAAMTDFPPPLVCPTGWFGHEASQKCYRVYHNLKLNKPFAKRFCEKQGGDLVVLKDQKVNEFIKGYLSNSNSYWIGLNPSNQKWMDGQNATYDQYEDWVHGFNYNTTGAFCATLFMDPTEGFRWMVAKCQTSLPFVCQSDSREAVCPKDWTVYHNTDNETSKCLKVFRNRMRWRKAEEDCRDHGGHLVTVENKYKNTFLKGLLSGPSAFYINKVDSGATIPFFGWGANQPTSSECTLLWIKDYVGGYRVYNTECDSPLPYICEKEQKCPHGWNMFKDTCFRVVYDKNENYDWAEKYCEEEDAILAIIPDVETNTFVAGLVTSSLTFWQKRINLQAISLGNYVTVCYYVRIMGRTIKDGHGNCSESYRFICMKVVPTQNDCDGDYFHIGTDSTVTCYNMSAFMATRDEADDYCRFEFDGQLFDGDFEPFKGQFFQDMTYGFYIGLKKGSPWRWSDNTEYILDRSMGWASGEPGAGTDKCVACYTGHSLPCDWHDVYCHNRYHFICQKETTLNCPNDWHKEPDGRKCFGFYRHGPKNWIDADQQCRRRGGQLLTVEDATYNKFVFRHFSTEPSRMWLSARRVGALGWKSNNAMLTYEDWGRGEPNNYNLNEACAAAEFSAYRNIGYKWIDIACRYNFGYVCERDPVKPRTGFKCPEGYTVYAEGKTCFKVLHNAQLEWQDARDVCVQDGGDLAVADDETTDYFLSGLLTGSHLYWFGLRSHDEDRDKYLWINSNTEQDNDTGNWLPNEPNIFLHMCVQYTPRPSTDLSSPGKDFAWGDQGCNQTKGAICQRGGNTHIYGLHDAVIEGQTYFFAVEGLHAGDVENQCKQHNLTQLFIKSNDHFAQIQAWVSNTSGLQDSHIWVQTKKPLFWDFNTWSDDEFVNPDAWVSDIQDRVCSKEQECCVFMARDTQRPGHYLTNANCSDNAIYICVKENNNTVSKISPPKIEPAKESVETLKQLMTSGNQTLNNKCPCRCGITFNPNPTPAELDLIKAQIVKKLIIKTDNLIATVSKKVSAKDDRESSKTIGFLAIVFICIPVVFIISIDITRIWQRQSE